MHIAPNIPKEQYETTLIKHLLDIKFLRILDGKLITSRIIAEETIGFETEDTLCLEWLRSIYDSYSFYNGFDTLNDCLHCVQNSHYDTQIFRIIRFNQMFYAVVYENTQHQQIIGKDLCYFTKNNMFLVAKNTPANLTIKARSRLPVIPIIYHELYAFDDNIQVYQLNNETNEYEAISTHDAIEYVVLLGVTFKDIWYSCQTQHEIFHNRAILNLYFNEGHGFTLFAKYLKALAINPFQRLVYLPKGRIEHFQTDIDDHRTPHRMLAYRELRRYHENIRTRPIEF